MDFFQSQDIARRNSVRLVIFFILAVLCLIAMTNLLVMLVFGYIESSEEGLNAATVAAQFDWQVFWLISIGVSIIVAAGSLYKILALSAGGSVVADLLGGRLINQNTADPYERRVLNVVEEMAIASATPVPPVYLLNSEEAINAFAAGYKPGDAVIGVTRGTIRNLNREELQGVIAHEFSHILHGDMRLNIRLIGVLHGILVIGLIGYHILRSIRGSDKDSAPVAVLGIGLMVIGYAGTFFGSMIKASVSRQREFLADASAVQFTRNIDGIAGALKKIGGFSSGSILETANAPAMSHAYFSDGVDSLLQNIFATHPPLAQRIKRIEPGWNGRYLSVTSTDATPVTRPTAEPGQAQQQALAGTVIAAQMLASVGQTTQQQLNHAAAMIQQIPQEIYQSVHEPYAARAVIYSLLIQGNDVMQEKQLAHIKQFADAGVYEITTRFYLPIKRLGVEYRLPLIDMCLPALRQLSPQQYQMFKKNISVLIKMDNDVNLFEWCLHKIISHYLDPVFGKSRVRTEKYSSLKALRKNISVLLSMLAHTCAGHNAQQAFNAAAKQLHMPHLEFILRESFKSSEFNQSLNILARLKPLLKPQLLKACLTCITYDRDYSAQDMELMRAIGSVLDCPIPAWQAMR